MEALYIDPDVELPGIILDKDESKFMIFGKSYPEEAKKFYDPAIKWLREYKNSPNSETEFHFKLEYYNTSTSTMLLEIFYILEEIKKKGSNVAIVWNYLSHDDDMLESGVEYEEIIRLDFRFAPYDKV